MLFIQTLRQTVKPMRDVTVTLFTGAHCIETESKNEFRKLTGLLLETDDESAADVMGEQLELLREFIGTADFNALRSSDERLAGIRPGACVIARGGDGKPVVREVEDHAAHL